MNWEKDLISDSAIMSKQMEMCRRLFLGINGKQYFISQLASMETEFLLVFSKLQYECGKADLDCNTAF